MGGSYPGETMAGVIFLVIACIGIYFLKLHGPLKAMLNKDGGAAGEGSEVTVLKYFLELLLASFYCSFAILGYAFFEGSFSMIVSLFPMTFPNMLFYSFIAMLITSGTAFAILIFKR